MDRQSLAKSENSATLINIQNGTGMINNDGLIMREHGATLINIQNGNSTINNNNLEIKDESFMINITNDPELGNKILNQKLSKLLQKNDSKTEIEKNNTKSSDNQENTHLMEPKVKITKRKSYISDLNKICVHCKDTSCVGFNAMCDNCLYENQLDNPHDKTIIPYSADIGVEFYKKDLKNCKKFLKKAMRTIDFLKGNISQLNEDSKLNC